MPIRFPTLAERPDLRGRARALMDVWPEFMDHDSIASAYLGRVRDELPEVQVFALDDASDAVLAEANAVPAAWDGDPGALPDRGLDAVLEATFADDAPAPNVLCALQIVVAPEHQGKGLSLRMIERMAALARERGLTSLVAPVRPSLKQRYPLTPIERYVGWRREDGRHLDPWIRTHERFGGHVARIAPRSMVVSGSIAEWEGWTGMAFPESGAYVVPGALEPVTMDVERDLGTYVEPNVWMIHRLPAPSREGS